MEEYYNYILKEAKKSFYMRLLIKLRCFIICKKIVFRTATVEEAEFILRMEEEGLY